MKQIASSSVVLSLLLASSANVQDVRYNCADAHYEKFKTYKWVEIKDAQKVDELKDKEIRRVLDTAPSRRA